MSQSLGVHNAQPINQIPWSSAPQDFEAWWNPNVPVFVGRYFGPTATNPGALYTWAAWKSGESRLNPPDQFLKYVGAFQGISLPTSNAMKSGDATQASVDAVLTLALLSSAIVTGDLAMSGSKVIYVFLDVEDFASGGVLQLSPLYWNLWATTVCHYPLFTKGVPSQPFRPAIYCYSTNAPAAVKAGTFSYMPDQGIQNALAGIDPNNPQSAPIPTVPCYAFWYANPRGENDPNSTLSFGDTALQQLSIADLASYSGYFPSWSQNSAVKPDLALEIPVEVWQFGSNVQYYPEYVAGQPAPSNAQLMDLDFSLTANATDHMAQMP